VYVGDISAFGSSIRLLGCVVIPSHFRPMGEFVYHDFYFGIILLSKLVVSSLFMAYLAVIFFKR